MPAQNPPEPLQLPFQTDARQPLPCPTCTKMRTLLLYNVAIDSCTKHGVWFDAQELATVLLRSAKRVG
ncbi:MAG: zf-TFIIB domain-containing protein [Deltaproteobacteria bacterium]|nr:zf-TFIIB domain-containing protein [Deltaproteobacteria bacterium]